MRRKVFFFSFLFCDNLIQDLPHTGDHGYHQGIAHAEIPHPSGHPGIRPVIVEPLEPFCFQREEDTETPSSGICHYMGAAVLGAFTGEHGPGGFVPGIREANRTFRKYIFMAIGSCTGDFFGTFQIGLVFQVIH